VLTAAYPSIAPAAWMPVTEGVGREPMSVAARGQIRPRSDETTQKRYVDLGNVCGLRRSTRRRFSMIRRREFIAGIGGAAAWPLAPSQQPALPIIG
jgi:hypothetical protein